MIVQANQYDSIGKSIWHITIQCRDLWQVDLLDNYNCFVDSIKYISTNLQGGLNVDCMYVYVDILGEELSIGVMRGRKGEKHSRTSWFFGNIKDVISSILGALALYVGLIEYF